MLLGGILKARWDLSQAVVRGVTLNRLSGVLTSVCWRATDGARAIWTHYWRLLVYKCFSGVCRCCPTCSSDARMPSRYMDSRGPWPGQTPNHVGSPTWIVDGWGPTLVHEIDGVTDLVRGDSIRLRNLEWNHVCSEGASELTSSTALEGLLQPMTSVETQLCFSIGWIVHQMALSPAALMQDPTAGGVGALADELEQELTGYSHTCPLTHCSISLGTRSYAFACLVGWRSLACSAK
eukprot:6207243-Amphidinium_carterae.2